MVNELLRHTRLLEIVGDTAESNPRMRHLGILRWWKMWAEKHPLPRLLS